jgi:PfaD family protein
MNAVTQIPAAETPRTPARAQPVWWSGSNSCGMERLDEVLREIDRPFYIVEQAGVRRIAFGGAIQHAAAPPSESAFALAASVPAVRPEALGDPQFRRDHGLRFAYMTGAMANGIASVRLVRAIAHAGMLGSFGAAGLSLAAIEEALVQLKSDPGGLPWCVNLIHSPNETGKEEATVDLLLRYGVRLIEASAYLALTLPAVRYRLHGIHTDNEGRIVAPNRIIAKVSRVEVASKWLSPPPEQMLSQLVAAGQISEAQAELARRIPMADDLTVEADSGGHTDNRPAITLIPTMLALRDRVQREHRYAHRPRVGAAGGIATPAGAAGAFAMGAAYIATGSVNQACVESGSSDLARAMLAEAGQADTAMAPAVDMFEMGVKVQVLKRGTLFPMRAGKLYECYRNYAGIEAIPAAERESLEKTIFRAPLEEIWKTTQNFFNERDPEQIRRAERDSKHKLALICRWYLGMSSRWAIAGEASRKADYQVWCGPAMGAFNEWTRGSHLEQPGGRRAVDVALNLLHGAAVISRANILRCQGIAPPEGCDNPAPVPVEELLSYSDYRND